MFVRQKKEGLLDKKEVATRLRDGPAFKVIIPVKESFKRSVQYAGSRGIISQ